MRAWQYIKDNIVLFVVGCMITSMVAGIGYIHENIRVQERQTQEIHGLKDDVGAISGEIKEIAKKVAFIQGKMSIKGEE